MSNVIAHKLSQDSKSVTQSRLDTTAGRLLKVGDGGINGVGAIISAGVDLDTVVNGGFYQVVNNAKAPHNYGSMFVSSRSDVANRAVQYFTGQSSTVTGLRTYIRSLTGGTGAGVGAVWTPWCELYHTGNLAPIGYDKRSDPGMGSVFAGQNGASSQIPVGLTGFCAYNHSDALNEDVELMYLRKNGGDGSTISINFGIAKGDPKFIGQRIRAYRTGTNGQGGLIFETKSDASNDVTQARMTIKPNGTINYANCPTSSAGLVSGDVWRDGDTLKIVP